MTASSMSPLRCVIVDDEPLSRRALRQLLDARDDVKVLAELGSALELAAAADGVDVLFLDIEMPVRSGIDLAAELARAGRGARRPLVVFVTAHDEYAVTAFDADAVDYLTKPVSAARLARALERVHDRLQVVARDDTTPRAPVSLVARVGTRDIVIPVAEVSLVEAEGVYAAVHLRGRRYLVRRSLQELERALGASGFIRVHRSYLVRCSSIVERRHARGGAYRELVLATGAVVPVSRRLHAAVARALGD